MQINLLLHSELPHHLHFRFGTQRYLIGTIQLAMSHQPLHGFITLDNRVVGVTEEEKTTVATTLERMLRSCLAQSQEKEPGKVLTLRSEASARSRPLV